MAPTMKARSHAPLRMRDPDAVQDARAARRIDEAIAARPSALASVPAAKRSVTASTAREDVSPAAARSAKIPVTANATSAALASFVIMDISSAYWNRPEIVFRS